jgi:hypothetical protein
LLAFPLAIYEFVKPIFCNLGVTAELFVNICAGEEHGFPFIVSLITLAASPLTGVVCATLTIAKVLFSYDLAECTEEWSKESLNIADNLRSVRKRQGTYVYGTPDNADLTL